jgi:hypothetical protein
MNDSNVMQECLGHDYKLLEMWMTLSWQFVCMLILAVLWKTVFNRWSMQLVLDQAIQNRRAHSIRPPPKPDPRGISLFRIVSFLTLLQCGAAVDPLSEGDARTLVSEGGTSAQLASTSCYIVGWWLVRSWLLLKLSLSRWIWHDAAQSVLSDWTIPMVGWSLAQRLSAAMPWSLIWLCTLNVARMVFEISTSIGTLLVLVWLAIKTSDLSDFVLGFMDKYHQPIPPCRRHQTHRPS